MVQILLMRAVIESNPGPTPGIEPVRKKSMKDTGQSIAINAISGFTGESQNQQTVVI